MIYLIGWWKEEEGRRDNIYPFSQEISRRRASPSLPWENPLPQEDFCDKAKGQKGLLQDMFLIVFDLSVLAGDKDLLV